MDDHFIDVDGTVLSVTLDHDGSQWVAYHAPSAVFGVGRSEEDAVEAIRVHLVEDKHWYCGDSHGINMGRTMTDRADTMRTLFDCEVDV